MSESQSPWPVLSLHERRVLGVLVEKAKTTPDTYPLSCNALVAGCNQKSARDPVLDLSDVEVEQALLALQKRGLVARITGGRVERWRHLLYESWQVNKVELAVLAELLLRGPQTEGELRGRASRMEPIDDLDALRAVLRPLSERRLVVYLGPEGRRGVTLTHGFHEPAELERLRARAGSEEASPAPRAEPRPQSQADLADLRQLVAELQAQVADLAEQVRALKDSLTQGAAPITERARQAPPA